MISIIKYSIVVPCYNEEEVIEYTYKRLKEVMENIKDNYEIIFVNDGSSDATEQLISKICKKDKIIKLINFSRNFGHQTAISAGLRNASGEAIIITDADLQDPPELIYEMIEKWKEGYDVVYGKRKNRKGETRFKKITANVFYKFLNYLTNNRIPEDVGEFRLIDKKVCKAFNELRERRRFIRGLISWVGFKQIEVLYDRDERTAGETKYNLKRMITLAEDGIFSFSYKPLKLSIITGIILFVLGFLYLVFLLFNKGKDNSNKIICIICFVSGLNFIYNGITNEYIERIHETVQNRPLYIIKNKINFNKKN